MKKCPECRGLKLIKCPVCKGTGIMRHAGKELPCSYCPNSSGYITCNICGGTGLLDDNDDYRK